MAVAVCRNCGRELTEEDFSGSTERGLCLDCSTKIAETQPESRSAGRGRRRTRRYYRQTRAASEDIDDDDEVVIDQHSSARNIAGWLTALSVLIFFGGLVGSFILGLAIATSCEESTAFGETIGDCDAEIATAWVVGIGGAVQSVIVGVLFFTGREVILLLVEIAEKD